MIRRRRTTDSGLSLMELTMAIIVSAVIMLVVSASLELTWRHAGRARARTESASSAFAVLDHIEKDIMRCAALEVPDPDYGKAKDVDSIQVYIPTDSGTVRRAFRLENGALVVDHKDEGVEPHTPFAGLTSLTFTILDEPYNSLVQISCTTEVKGKALQMQTVAKRRN